MGELILRVMLWCCTIAAVASVAAQAAEGSQPKLPKYHTLESNADICMNCTTAQLKDMALQLTKKQMQAEPEAVVYNTVFLVDPVKKQYSRLAVTGFYLGQSSHVTATEQMTAAEQQLFQPLMAYATSVLEMQQFAAQLSPARAANLPNCATALDAYINKECAGALRKTLENEAQLRKLLEFQPFDYEVKLQANSRVVEGSVTISGQGSNGKILLSVHWDDGSVTVFEYTDNVLKLDLKLSRDKDGEPLAAIIATLSKPEFFYFHTSMSQLISQMMVRSQLHGKICRPAGDPRFGGDVTLACHMTKVNSGNYSLNCSKAGSNDKPTLVYICL